MPAGFSKFRVAKNHILEIVSEEVSNYLLGFKRHKHKKRHCAWCGKLFWPRMRFHFLCSDICRRHWYRGWFRPKGA